MVELKRGADFIGFRVLCCYFLTALVWVFPVTVHGSLAGLGGTTQNSDSFVQYMPKPVVQHRDNVSSDCNTRLTSYPTVSVSGENGTQYSSKPWCSRDRRTIDEKDLENQRFSDEPIVSISTTILGRTYYLVKEFQDIETKIRLWSDSTRSQNGSQIDLLTRTTGNKTEYLDELVISQNGRSFWSTEPVSSTTILVEGNHTDYVAQASDTDHWIKLYTATRQPTCTSAYLRSLVTEITEQIEGRLYYLIQQFQNGEMQFQLWSTSSTEVAASHPIVDLVRRKKGTDTLYLKNITIWEVGTISCSWELTPPSFVSIAVENRSGVKYIAEIRQTSNETSFYAAVALFGDTSASLLQDLTQVTTKVLGATYYLLDQVEAYSGDYIQLWSRSPVDSENGTQIHLVTKKRRTFTEYLTTLSKWEDGTITRTWSGRPRASTVFRIIDPTGSSSVAAPTRAAVLRCFN